MNWNSFLQMNIRLFQYHLLKGLYFLGWTAFAKKLFLYTGLFLDLLFHLSIYFSVFIPVLHCLHDCRLRMSWNPVVFSLQLCFYFFEVVLALPVPLHFHMNFRSGCQFLQKPAGILIGIEMNLWMDLGRNNILTGLSLSVHEHSTLSTDFGLL